MKDKKGKDKEKKVKTDVSYRLKYLQTYTQDKIIKLWFSFTVKLFIGSGEGTVTIPREITPMQCK